MKYFLIFLFLSFSSTVSAKMVEDGMGYVTEKTEADSTYQKWLSIKSNVEKKIRVFFGLDKTEEKIKKARQEQIAIKQKKEEQKQKLLSELPSFKSDREEENIKKLQQAKGELSKKTTFNEVSPAVPADKSLKKDKAGVAYLPLIKKEKRNKKIVKIKIKDLPKLNIGQERKVSANEFSVPNLEKYLIPTQTIKDLKSPNLYSDQKVASWAKYKINPAKYQDIELKTLKSLGLTLAMIDKINWMTRKNYKFDLKKLDKLSKEESRLLQALILENNNACHSALGLYYPLQNSRNKQVEKTATLRSAICNHKMGFFHQSISGLLDVINDKEMNLDARKKAYLTLVKEIPYEHEIQVGRAFLERPTKGVSNVDQNSLYYYITKYLLRTKQYPKALTYALKVNKKSKHYAKAQYAAAVSEHLTGKEKASLKRQRRLLSYIKKNRLKDKNVKNLVRINLARYAFQNRKYNESIKHYRQMDRKHPLWFESLQELGWAQLSNGDEPGAIGNMHSVHAPFFKKVYKPASYAIRSIGYLNLCHYGDAYRSLTNLEETYRSLASDIRSYTKKHRGSKAKYKSMKSYLTGEKVTNSLPPHIMREVARRKDFLNAQEALNKIVDEKQQYSFIEKFIKKDQRKLSWLIKKNKQRVKDLKRKVKLAKNNKKYFKNLVNWTRQLDYEQSVADFYQFKKEVLKTSRNTYKLIKKRGIANLNSKRGGLQAQAGNIIAKHLKSIRKELITLFKNNEFLRYEVFAGAGENIRYHVGGGKVEAKRLPASAKPKTKDLKWKYDGEFWQDEVGFYRSTLKSNCPQR